MTPKGFDASIQNDNAKLFNSWLWLFEKDALKPICRDSN